MMGASRVTRPLICAARVVILLGLIAVGGSCLISATHAEPAPEAALWRAAGVVRFTRAVEAPDFQLRDLKWQLVNLREFRGRRVLVYFWATW